MKPKPQPRDAFELFQAHFDQMLNPNHELILLADKIDWSGMEAAFVDTYCSDFGAPAKAIRLMVGLHYLKYAFDESDESVVSRWVENPYWQCFCGYTHMQHECPIHPTSMTKWRNRVGAKRLEKLLEETVRLAVREKHLPQNDLERVTVDTTVQEKNITFPTDSKLLYKAIRKLGVTRRSHVVSRCGSRTFGWARRRRSRRVVTPTPGSTSVCVDNFASYARTWAGSFATFGARLRTSMRHW